MGEQAKRPVLTEKAARRLLQLAQYAESQTQELENHGPELEFKREIWEATSWLEQFARWKLDQVAARKAKGNQ